MKSCKGFWRPTLVTFHVAQERGPFERPVERLVERPVLGPPDKWSWAENTYITQKCHKFIDL